MRGSLAKQAIPRIHDFDEPKWVDIYREELELSLHDDDRVEGIVPCEEWCNNTDGARNKLIGKVHLDLRRFLRDLDVDARNDDLASAMESVSTTNAADITADQRTDKFSTTSRVSMPGAIDGIGVVSKARASKPITYALEKKDIYKCITVVRILLLNGNAFVWEGAGCWKLHELLSTRFKSLQDHSRRLINAELVKRGKIPFCIVDDIDPEITHDFADANAATNQELLDGIMPPSIDLV